jgi:hypothetical protein
MKSWPAHIVLYASIIAAPVLVAAQATGGANGKNAEEQVRRLNREEVQAFLDKDPNTMRRLWSPDLVVTNPLNKFVTGQQVLGMMESGLLVITSYDRQIEYLKVYGDTVIVAGPETVVWGWKDAQCGQDRTPALHGLVDETERPLAGSGAPRQHRSGISTRRPVASEFKHLPQHLLRCEITAQAVHAGTGRSRR